MDEAMETVLLLAAIPQDLRDVLAGVYDLARLPDTSDGPPTGCRIAVTISMAGADAAVMDRLPGLCLIACQGAGLDRIDLAAAAARGIAVSHTPDVLTEDTADFAIALLYGTARKVVLADRFVRDGRWSRERMVPSTRLHGKCAGIVGLGRIGEAVARRAAGIGMAVSYTGPRPKPNLPYTFVPSVQDLAERSDVLILACPGGEATHHLVGADILSRLGPGGFLINIARGTVVQEAALLEALEEKRIAGAGLDVFAAEPELDPRFLPLENVVLAPHYASLTHETRAAMIGRLLGDIAAFRAGTPFHDAAAAFRHLAR
ncbi:2-hydroxyacid dehydrogenase [Dankookia sp. P2]|uniref:2-hydroxyacid dehydrogenase n=1 Tax=Dankookia sp. P2 TaxID=3423955 RepID=UPI003D678671